MDYLYQKKREYEKLLNDLNNLYTKLEDCYSNLFLCRKKMEKCITMRLRKSKKYSMFR